MNKHKGENKALSFEIPYSFGSSNYFPFHTRIQREGDNKRRRNKRRAFTVRIITGVKEGRREGGIWREIFFFFFSLNYLFTRLVSGMSVLAIRFLGALLALSLAD